MEPTLFLLAVAVPIVTIGLYVARSPKSLRLQTLRGERAVVRESVRGLEVVSTPVPEDVWSQYLNERRRAS